MENEIKIHIVDITSFKALSNRINEFNIDKLQLWLKQSNLTIEQKINAVDKIIENLKLREIDKILK